MNQEIGVDRLLLIIAKQQVNIDVLNERVVGLMAEVRQLTEKDKDEDTKDS